MADIYPYTLSLSLSLTLSLYHTHTHTLSLSNSLFSFTFPNKPLHTPCLDVVTFPLSSKFPFQVRRGSKMELSHWSTAFRLNQSGERSAYAMSGNVNFTPKMKGLGPVQLKQWFHED